MDLEGCGDSSGEFGEATWHGWVDDLLCAERWLADRVGRTCWLWGLRAGCLVAAEAGARLGGRNPLLLWQPVLSGRLHLTQFLRLKLAGEAIGQSEERTGVKAPACSSGGRNTPGDHRLHPLIRRSPQRSRAPISTWIARPRRSYGVKSAPKPSRGLLPASQVRVDGLRVRGVRVDVVAISGPPFWHTVEIAEAPALVAATTPGHSQGSMSQSIEEKAFLFHCEGEDLLGILTLPAEPASAGVLIVVGGPQCRVGSGWQCATLHGISPRAEPAACASTIAAWETAAAQCGPSSKSMPTSGPLSTRFTQRVLEPRASCFGGFATGLGNLFYAATDPRVTGVVLVNPWVRTQVGEARTYLRHYPSAGSSAGPFGGSSQPAASTCAGQSGRF